MTTFWSSVELASQFMGPNMNTVLYYFAASPFCDPTSNNTSLFNQCQHNPTLHHILATAQSFQSSLDKMPGLEYRLHDYAQLHGPDTLDHVGHPGLQRFVIRKQLRTRSTTGREERWKVSVLAVYVVLGPTIFPAPRMRDVLNVRLLNTVAAFSRVVAAAEKERYWTPATGHTLYHPTLHRAPLKKSGGSGSAQSRAGSPTPALSDTASVTGVGAGAGAGLGTTADEDDSGAAGGIASPAAFRESFTAYLKYSSEYMDENPLVGEPGSFIFKSSRKNLQQQREAEDRAKREREESEAKAKAKIAEVMAANRSRQATLGQASESARKASMGTKSKIKRKRSRHGGPGSPTSPLSAVASPSAGSPD